MITICEKDLPRIALIDPDYQYGFRIEFKWRRNFHLVDKPEPDILTLPTEGEAIKAAQAWVFDGKAYKEIKRDFGVKARHAN